MGSLSLGHRDWKAFFLEEVVSIDGGKRLTKADMRPGDMPFVGASEANNGITAFTGSINESLDQNVLGVNYNGSVGFAFYHPYQAIFSDDVKRMKWKNPRHNNRYTLLFLASMIRQQKGKYAYGYKFNSQRMKRQKILLPIRADNSIDWAFMEEFMRQKEQQILKPILEGLCKRLTIKDIYVCMGVAYSALTGRRFISRRCLLKSSGVDDSEKRITQRGRSLMYLPRRSIMASMDLSVTRVGKKV